MTNIVILLLRRNDEPLIHIKLPNIILPEIFQIILRYIYGGRLSLEEYDALDIIKILVAASELSLQELVDYIQSFLTKNKADWMEQNFNLIYQTSFEKVWENVLKWGFAQNPGFPSDPSNFSKDDFTSLKNTLHQCIPFELYMDLLKTFLDPDSKPIDKPKPRKGTNNSSETSSSKYQDEDRMNEDYYYSQVF
ncbi:BTB/POZ protein [Rhizophagus irregularis DAOM 181602=DAOM 197198]|nr:BTB/POZ protein [Rhizophagus irregularis DAOM 181602=DAOM 197198]